MNEKAYVISAEFYDEIYAGKDYSGESKRLAKIIARYLHSGGRRLLDVACGTGKHIEYLKVHFETEGLDINPGLVEIAARRNAGIPFHCGDMIDFDLKQKFDVVTCLFSSIGYVKTLENLERAVRCMGSHVAPGGLLIIEPWFTPDAWMPDTVHSLFIDRENFKLARINTSKVDGKVSIFNLHHLVGTPRDTVYFVEHHEMGLFEKDEMLGAYRHAGLEVFYDQDGLTGRGLYIGRQPGG